MMWWIVMGAWALVVVGIVTVLHKRVAEFDAAEARKEKLLGLIALADEYDAASTDRERSAIYRKASDLGLTDSDREWEGSPFALDDSEQPHKPAA